MQDLSQLSNIQLELELTKVKRSVWTHNTAFEDINNICKEKYDLSIDDLYEIMFSDSSKLQALLAEYDSRINDLGLSAFETTLGQAE
jgi:hypothetical protein